MKPLPQVVHCYRRTPEFSESTIPSGLTSAHRTKSGTWGKIVIVEGTLRYQIFEPVGEEHELDKEHPGVIEPQQLHTVEPIGKVRFYVEFYR